MMTKQIKNAVIEAASIEVEDHDLLTAWLHLDYGGTGQGFGGYALHLPGSYTHAADSERVNFAGIFIRGCLDCAGVRKWSDLKGKTIRVESDHSKVYRIGHIVKDLWFDPTAAFEKCKP